MQFALCMCIIAGSHCIFTLLPKIQEDEQWYHKIWLQDNKVSQNYVLLIIEAETESTSEEEIIYTDSDYALHLEVIIVQASYNSIKSNNKNLYYSYFLINRPDLSIPNILPSLCFAVFGFTCDLLPLPCVVEELTGDDMTSMNGGTEKRKMDEQLCHAKSVANPNY